MTLKTGWRVVCPDGQERHFPYFNHGDALFDAEVFSRDRARFPDCPEGAHTVEPVTFQPASGRAQS